MKQNAPSDWNQSYLESARPGWDIGYCSTPLREYFDQLSRLNERILIPGAGNAWEAEYLYRHGFSNVYVLDFAEKPIEQFLKRVPDFPQNQIIIEDFFEHKGTYDVIIEQTFFSAIPRDRRNDYARHCFDLLHTNGRLVGLLFNHEFPFKHQPFGGTPDEYIRIFRTHFNFRYFETAYNSIKPRVGRELFIFLRKKDMF